MKEPNPDIPISNFPGAIPVYEHMKKIGVGRCLKKSLPRRATQAFQYDEALMSWFMTIYCHGFRLNRMENAREDLGTIPGLEICSHDVIGRMLKALASKTHKQIHKNNKKVGEKRIREYHVSYNMILNDLLVKMSVQLGLLKRGANYIVDMDATPIRSQSKDSKPSYKVGSGYSPMVCMIKEIPVFVALYSGNAAPGYGQKDCIERCRIVLKKYGIGIKRVRIDGVGYAKELTNYMVTRGFSFLTVGKWKPPVIKLIEKHKDWKPARFKSSRHDFKKAEFASAPFTFSEDTTCNVYRAVFVRIPKEVRDEQEHKTKWNLHEGYYYKMLLTNDYGSTPLQLFKEYNKRGAGERNFDYLKNHFGWKTLPFMRLNENHVYLLIGAMCYNVYTTLARHFSKVSKLFKKTCKLPKFLREFIKSGFFQVISKKIIYLNIRKELKKILR